MTRYIPLFMRYNRQKYSRNIVNGFGFSLNWDRWQNSYITKKYNNKSVWLIKEKGY